MRSGCPSAGCLDGVGAWVEGLVTSVSLRDSSSEDSKANVPPTWRVSLSPPPRGQWSPGELPSRECGRVLLGRDNQPEKLPRPAGIRTGPGAPQPRAGQRGSPVQVAEPAGVGPGGGSEETRWAETRPHTQDTGTPTRVAVFLPNAKSRAGSPVSRVGSGRPCRRAGVRSCVCHPGSESR